MKCLILFSRKNKKNIISLSSDEFAYTGEMQISISACLDNSFQLTLKEPVTTAEDFLFFFFFFFF